MQGRRRSSLMNECMDSLPWIQALHNLTHPPKNSGRPRGISPAFQEPTSCMDKRLQELGWPFKLREALWWRET